MGAASVSVVVAGWVVAGIQNTIWLTVFELASRLFIEFLIGWKFLPNVVARRSAKRNVPRTLVHCKTYTVENKCAAVAVDVQPTGGVAAWIKMRSELATGMRTFSFRELGFKEFQFLLIVSSSGRGGADAAADGV